MSNDPIKVLLVEDNLGDFRPLREFLKGAIWGLFRSESNAIMSELDGGRLRAAPPVALRNQ